jgi:hypothetical protein
VKINALLIALLLGVSSLVPVQAATQKSGTSHAASHRSKNKRVKQAKHSKARAQASKSKKS